MAISDDCTVPHDQESLKQTLDSILAELDSLVKSAQSIVREEFLYV
jgi:Zn-finger protein